MGRLFCNGKGAFCERVQGTEKECEEVSCTDCGFADGTGSKFVNEVTNYDNIRNMSIGEMTEWIRRNVGCGSDFMPCGTICEGKCKTESTEECVKKIKQWLLEPVSNL